MSTFVTAPTIDRRTVDVAVVGAGLSGLSAARRLHRAGLSVLVLEARDRVGGKTFAPELNGHPVDLGAHWLDRKHERALRLADELGLRTERQSSRGRHLLAVDGGRREFSGDLPLRPALGLLELALRVAEVEITSRLVPEGRPWTARKATRWDQLTLADWLDRFRDRSRRALMVIACRTIFGAEPGELSLLYALDYLRAGGGLTRLSSFRGGAQDVHVVGGTEQLSAGLARELGDRVVLGSPVREIVRGPGDVGVEVVCDRLRVSADRVVVATSPATLELIRFSPALPTGRQDLQRRMPLGGYVKAVVAYDRPWWRDRGLSGLALTDVDPLQMTVDVGHPGGPGVLAAFVAGAPARALPADPGRRREAIMAALVDLWGPEAAKPTAYADLDWSLEEWSLGAPTGLMAPGVLTSYGEHLRRPVGPIHWAGTECATRFTGYLEGAIIAGDDAAEAVLHRHRATRGPRGS